MGETYAVVLDGKEYVATAYERTTITSGLTFKMIGNAAQEDGTFDENGPPFTCATMKYGEQVMLIMNIKAEVGTHTVEIYKFAEVIHTIAPEFLPEGYPYKETRVTVDVSGMLGPGAVLCKVSDDVPANVADFTGLKIWKNGEGVAVTPAIVNEMGYVDAVLGCVIACVDNANFDLGGMYLTIPEAGVYLLKAESAGICMTGVAWDSNATQPDITWDGQTGTLQRMAEEFMPLLTSPNGTKYKLTVSDDGTLSAVAQS